jgi:hypothetical protein
MRLSNIINNTISKSMEINTSHNNLEYISMRKINVYLVLISGGTTISTSTKYFS